MTQGETLWQFLDRIAGEPRGSQDSPVPPIQPAGCIPMLRFSQRLGLTAENRQHAAGCERCQRALAAAWRVRCPGLRELRAYASAGSEYPLARVLSRHAGDCRRCDIVIRLLQLGSLVMNFPGGVAQAMARVTLEGSQASTVGLEPGPAVMNLTIEGGQPMEVLVQVEGESVRIHATSQSADPVGKWLRVDLWDDSGCTTYIAPIHAHEGGAVAQINGAPGKLGTQSFARQGVAVACVQDSPEPN